MHLFETLESEVRSYSRSFPTIFQKAKDHLLTDINGKTYIDFFDGAGALNYGHNNDHLKQALLRYIESDGITHGLDMATVAKGHFLESFNEVILAPRKLPYKVMFPGPTGTNAVEAALKLARKVTGRDLIVSFTNAFHGMTAGALALTGNTFKRSGAGIPLDHAVHMPYDGYLGEKIDTIALLEQFLDDAGSGVDLPAAVIVETVQGEGGLHTASAAWLRRLSALCKRYEMLLIVDDVQVGCGRTGTFFSFEPAGLYPDIVCLSKSIGGYGLPMSLTLIRPELDLWAPGEHNGTFRGNNPAFVTATAALDYWSDDHFSREIEAKSQTIRQFLEAVAADYPDLVAAVRGRGMIQGLYCPQEGIATAIAQEAFRRQLLVETSGPNSEVVKVLPPLTIAEDALQEGLSRLNASVASIAETMAPMTHR